MRTEQEIRRKAQQLIIEWIRIIEKLNMTRLEGQDAALDAKHEEYKNKYEALKWVIEEIHEL